MRTGLQVVDVGQVRNLLGFGNAAADLDVGGDHAGGRPPEEFQELVAQVESLPHQCRGVRRCRQGRPGLDVGSWDGILHPGEVEGLHGLEVAHGVGQGSAAGLDRDLHLLADFPPNVLDLTDQPAQALARQVTVHDGARDPEHLGGRGIEFQTGDAQLPIDVGHALIVLQVSHAAIEAHPVPMLSPQQLVYRRAQGFPGNVPKGGFHAAGGMGGHAAVEMGGAEIAVGPPHHPSKQPLDVGGILAQ